MKKKRIQMEESDTESDENSDQELQEAFARGELKPGLNVIAPREEKKLVNKVNLMKQTLEKIKLNLPWIERLDMTNALAPMAPELALQLQEQEIRRSKELQGNKKLQQYEPKEDPVLNEFRTEMTFHRQAQGAVLEGIKKLQSFGIPTRRPDDYFAEMAKTDEHMQKVRQNLQKKRIVAERSEKMRQLRTQKKVAKRVQIESTLKKHAEKKKLLQEVKKYRKGTRKDLDFLEDNKTRKNKKFGFGGKKRDTKKNTRESCNNFSEYTSQKSKFQGKKNKSQEKKTKRPGKMTRLRNKAKQKRS